MCGIVGYVGRRQAAPVLYQGLRRLEYRGYDSAGIAVLSEHTIRIVKRAGAVSAIERDALALHGTIGIGHTRWATHGEPSAENAHPHQSGKFAIVHNGIIENFAALRAFLREAGYAFASKTDSEVICHLLSYYDEGDLLLALAKTVARLQGSFAIAVLDADAPDTVAVAKRNSPLIVGSGRGEAFAASDIPALAGLADAVYVLGENEFALVRADGIRFFDAALSPIRKEPTSAAAAHAVELCGYPHFMAKEIGEIPRTVEETLRRFAFPAGFEAAIARAKRLQIVGCGTAYHSGLAAKVAFERLCRLPVEVCVASEYRYGEPIVDESTLVIAVSQSGETADTLAAAKLAKERGAMLAAVTNTDFSSLARLTEFVFFTEAGAEISVAATKSYAGQLVVFYRLALALAGLDSKALSAYSALCARVLEDTARLQAAAQRIKTASYVSFLGRGADYAAALEGSLKLKEVSYLPSEGYPAGELKHGPIALIDGRAWVVVLMTCRALAEKTYNAVSELKARGAKILLVSPFSEYAEREEVDLFFGLPACDELFSPLVSVIPLQALAYYAALAAGNNPDRPRNLAKSVTVE